ncbi:MAG: hypothetical protein ACTSW1_02920 [Candidatus Hodarchaeales archaeon]
MKNKILSLTFIMIIMFMTINTLVVASAQPRSLKDSPPLEVEIYDAYYDDLDLDSYEDDIDIFVIFTFNYNGVLRATFTLDLALPSGLTFSFILEAWFYNCNCPIRIKISTFNTAIESGWYTATLSGFIRGSPLGTFYTMSSLIFDPPTGQGSGNPTASIEVL